MVRQIHNDPSSFFRPTGAIARVTTPVMPGEGIDSRFLNFQEVPLYHGLCALVAMLGVSLEVAGHLVSIAFWLLQWGAIKRLVRERSHLERCLIDLVYLTSFAVTYYGQAIMSDIAMAAIGAWAVERAVSWRLHGNLVTLFIAVVCVGLSALFKSYGLIFAIPVLALTWPRLISWRMRGAMLLGVTVTSLPVVWWHVYAMLQGGYHEASSHGIENKLTALLNPRLYKAFWRYYTHFVGIIPGVLALGGIVWLRFTRSESLRIPDWVLPWIVALVPYSIATLDKLTDHEYYILPFAVPLIVVVGICCARIISLGATARRSTLLICIFFVVQMSVSYRSITKAQRENPDVVACADVLRQATQPEELVAFASDTQRYNSLAYYAERRGFHVDGEAFPAVRYVQEGATVFLLARDSKDQAATRMWLRRGGKRAFVLIASSEELRDFRGKSRTCQVFRWIHTEQRQ